MPKIMPWHRTELVDPEFTRVDLVKEGANSQAHIKLFKNKGGNPMNLEEILAKMVPEHAAIVREALEAKDTDVDALTKAKKDLEDELQKVKDEQEIAKSGESSEEEILKTVKDPAVRKLLETQIAKAKAAEDEVRKSREAALNTEAIAKAAEVPAIGAEQEVLVDMYKKLKGTDPELCDNVFGVLKAANALVSTGGVFQEIGKSGAAASGVSATEEQAWAKIEKAAEELAKSKNVELSKAISEVINSQPELYQDYIKAQTGAN